MTNPVKNRDKSKDKSRKEARDIRAEALKIANSQHIEGQTREQTRLIAAGIQRGMEQFLRQQSEKARELDKRVKKVKRLAEGSKQADTSAAVGTVVKDRQPLTILPWALLILSWIFFTAYLWLSS